MIDKTCNPCRSSWIDKISNTGRFNRFSRVTLVDSIDLVEIVKLVGMVDPIDPKIHFWYPNRNSLWGWF